MSIKTVNLNTGEETTSGAVAPSFEPTLAEKRETANITRAEFLNAAEAAGIITEAVAEEAADGSWPSSFDAVVSVLPASERVNAKATWADGGNVRRNNTTLSLLQSALNLTDAQLDALFGIS